MEQFEDVFDRVVEVTKGAGMLNRFVELMINSTNLPFYGCECGGRGRDEEAQEHNVRVQAYI